MQNNIELLAGSSIIPNHLYGIFYNRLEGSNKDSQSSIIKSAIGKYLGNSLKFKTELQENLDKT